LQTLAAVDRMKPFFASMYGIDFDIRIGLHLGEAVIGSVGPPGHERLTAIGDDVNVASRVEGARKPALGFSSLSRFTIASKTVLTRPILSASGFGALRTASRSTRS
jgi:class 3 adenylate cyclase